MLTKFNSYISNQILCLKKYLIRIWARTVVGIVIFALAVQVLLFILKLYGVFKGLFFTTIPQFVIHNFPWIYREVRLLKQPEAVTDTLELITLLAVIAVISYTCGELVVSRTFANPRKLFSQLLKKVPVIGEQISGALETVSNRSEDLAVGKVWIPVFRVDGKNLVPGIITYLIPPLQFVTSTKDSKETKTYYGEAQAYVFTPGTPFVNSGSTMVCPLSSLFCLQEVVWESPLSGVTNSPVTNLAATNLAATTSESSTSGTTSSANANLTVNNSAVSSSAGNSSEAAQTVTTETKCLKPGDILRFHATGGHVAGDALFLEMVRIAAEFRRLELVNNGKAETVSLLNDDGTIRTVRIVKASVDLFQDEPEPAKGGLLPNILQVLGLKLT